VDNSLGYLLQNACSNEIVLGSSSEDYEFLSNSMRLNEYFVTGYARNDIFYRSPVDFDLINVDLSSMQKLSDTNSKKIIYAPTWRIGNHYWIQSSQLNKIRDRLNQIGIELWVNLHPFEANLNIDFLNKNKINYIKPDTDIYPLLGKFNALITDYSSISIDFIHANRPIFLYWSDSDQYFSDRRMLNSKNLERLGVQPLNKLCCLIDKIHESSNSDFIPNSNAKSLHDYMDGRSSERTCITIEELLIR
jgi:CDP-glycerol glycerophosphotransferase (TagB/SpsB family)